MIDGMKLAFGGLAQILIFVIQFAALLVSLIGVLISGLISLGGGGLVFLILFILLGLL